jgi:hypothetical protein
MRQPRRQAALSARRPPGSCSSSRRRPPRSRPTVDDSSPATKPTASAFNLRVSGSHTDRRCRIGLYRGSNPDRLSSRSGIAMPRSVAGLIATTCPEHPPPLAAAGTAPILDSTRRTNSGSPKARRPTFSHVARRILRSTGVTGPPQRFHMHAPNAHPTPAPSQAEAVARSAAGRLFLGEIAALLERLEKDVGTGRPTPLVRSPSLGWRSRSRSVRTAASRVTPGRFLAQSRRCGVALAVRHAGITGLRRWGLAGNRGR